MTSRRVNSNIMRGARGIGAALLLACLAGCSGAEDRRQQYLSRAQEHFDAGNYPKAAVDVRNALQIDGDHAPSRYLYALILEQGKDWQQMIANLRLATELDPNLLKARMKYGTLLLAAQLFDEALSEAEAVLEREPGHAEAHALMAATYLRRGEPRLAQRAAYRSLSMEPGNMGAVAVLTQIHRDENPGLALEIIRGGIERHTRTAALMLLEISVYEAQGELEKTRDAYSALIRSHSENLYYYYLFVTFLQKHDRTDEAAALLWDVVNARNEVVELKLWLVQFLVDQGNVEAAEEALLHFMKTEPRQMDLVFALGQVYGMRGELDRARQLYRTLIEPGNESEAAQKARNALVELDFATDNAASGRALLAEIFRIEPNNPQALITRARMALADVRPEAAISDLRLVLMNQPGSVDALLLLGQAYRATDAEDLAIDHYRQVLTVQPGNHDALLALTESAFRNGELATAANLAAAAVRFHPESDDAARVYVLSRVRLERWQEAGDFATQLVASERRQVLGLYLQGRIEHAKGRYPDAIERLERALVLQPDLVEALGVLVSSYRSLGQPERALERLKAHADEHQDQVHVHLLLAETQMTEGDYSSAETSLHRAVEADPADATAYRVLSDLYVRRGEGRRALEILKRGIDANPRNAELLIAAAGLHEQHGSYAQAARYYQRSIAVGGGMVATNNLAMLYANHLATETNLGNALEMMRRYATSAVPEVLDTLGWIHYRLGNFEQAMRYFENALTNGGNDPVMHYHLGMAYLAAKRLEDARHQLVQAQQPGNGSSLTQDIERAIDSMALERSNT